MPGFAGLSQKGKVNRCIVDRMVSELKHIESHKTSTRARDGLAVGFTTGGWVRKVKKMEKERVNLYVVGDFIGVNNVCKMIYLGYIERDSWEFLSKVEGRFGVIIFDKMEDEIHIANDRHGMFSVYWLLNNKRLAWSTELKAFRKSKGIDNSLDRNAIRGFLERGYCEKDKTWFSEVSLLPPGSVLSWKVGSRTKSIEEYWSWSQIDSDNRLTEEQIIEGLHSKFEDAVNKRCKDACYPGLTLSGGLDSRAIFATMPCQSEPIPALTFGKCGAIDIKKAREIAKSRPSQHKVSILNRENWFESRLDSVWWTDGETSFKHMHGSRALAEYMPGLMDVCLNGYLGDATVGGSYIGSEEGEINRIVERGRRFIRVGLLNVGVYVPCRVPFFDYKFLDFAMSIPKSYRQNGYIYKRFLKSRYDIFNDVKVPYNNRGQKIKIVFDKIKDRLSYVFGENKSDSFHSYPRWMRSKGFEGIIGEIQCNGRNFAKELGFRGLKEAYDRHINGWYNSEYIGRVISMEYFLNKYYGEW